MRRSGVLATEHGRQAYTFLAGLVRGTLYFKVIRSNDYRMQSRWEVVGTRWSPYLVT